VHSHHTGGYFAYPLYQLLSKTAAKVQKKNWNMQIFEKENAKVDKF